MQEGYTNMSMQSPMPEGMQVLAADTSAADSVLQQLFKPKFTDVSIEQLRRAQQMFASERDWDQFHTPRNLVLALVGEVGELAEAFQWKGEVKRDLPTFLPAERTHVAEELSDVLLYLVRLADICGIDLGAAVLEKLQKNANKYPVEKCRGNNQKYTQYTPNLQKKEPLLRTGTPGDHADSDLGDSSAKRKRFSEAQVGILTQIAEEANWSLLQIPQEERDRICEEYGITKERLQNFFNNRKPNHMKKVRTKTGSHQSGELEQVGEMGGNASVGNYHESAQYQHMSMPAQPMGSH